MGEDGGVRLWGMTAGERWRRALRRAGVSRFADLDDMDGGAQVLAFDGGWIGDAALASGLASRPGAALLAADGALVAAYGPGEIVRAAFASGSAAGLEPLTAEQLSSGYDAALRRRGPPLLMRLTAGTVRPAEAALFAASYKGVTDLVTKHVWPLPARIVTRWCAAAGVSPNQVTAASLVLVLVAFALFWRGEFGWGLLAAWVMTFLDTVDGKLARVTLRSSPLGNVFDHGIDLIHPPFWWWAWLVGLGAAGWTLPHAPIVLAVVAGGYVAQRLVEGAFLALHRMEAHVWRPFDSLFRQVTARRNPNLILLSLGWIAGRPDWGLLAVAAWTAASLAVHVVRLAQAQWSSRRGALTSWMAE